MQIQLVLDTDEYRHAPILTVALLCSISTKQTRKPCHSTAATIPSEALSHLYLFWNMYCSCPRLKSILYTRHPQLLPSLRRETSCQNVILFSMSLCRKLLSCFYWSAQLFRPDVLFAYNGMMLMAQSQIILRIMFYHLVIILIKNKKSFLFAFCFPYCLNIVIMTDNVVLSWLWMYTCWILKNIMQIT